MSAQQSKLYPLFWSSADGDLGGSTLASHARGIYSRKTIREQFQSLFSSLLKKLKDGGVEHGVSLVPSCNVLTALLSGKTKAGPNGTVVLDEERVLGFDKEHRAMWRALKLAGSDAGSEQHACPLAAGLKATCLPPPVRLVLGYMTEAMHPASHVLNGHFDDMVDGEFLYGGAEAMEAYGTPVLYRQAPRLGLIEAWGGGAAGTAEADRRLLVLEGYVYYGLSERFLRCYLPHGMGGYLDGLGGLPASALRLALLREDDGVEMLAAARALVGRNGGSLPKGNDLATGIAAALAMEELMLPSHRSFKKEQGPPSMPMLPLQHSPLRILQVNIVDLALDAQRQFQEHLQRWDGGVAAGAQRQQLLQHGGVQADMGIHQFAKELAIEAWRELAAGTPLRDRITRVLETATLMLVHVPAAAKELRERGCSMREAFDNLKAQQQQQQTGGAAAAAAAASAPPAQKQQADSAAPAAAPPAQQARAAAEVAELQEALKKEQAGQPTATAATGGGPRPQQQKQKQKQKHKQQQGQQQQQQQGKALLFPIFDKAAAAAARKPEGKRAVAAAEDGGVGRSRPVPAAVPAQQQQQQQGREEEEIVIPDSQTDDDFDFIVPPSFKRGV